MTRFEQVMEQVIFNNFGWNSVRIGLDLFTRSKLWLLDLGRNILVIYVHHLLLLLLSQAMSGGKQA